MKLATNVFLATKVAFANELARIVEAYGGDVGPSPMGSAWTCGSGGRLTAGPGYGGSCLPEQAIALSQIAAAHGADAARRCGEPLQRDPPAGDRDPARGATWAAPVRVG